MARRLIIALTTGTAVLWLVAVAAATLIVRHELNETFDSALQETAQRLLPLAVDDIEERDDDDEPHEISDDVEIAEHKEYLTYQVRDARGRILLRSHDAPAAPYAVPLERGFVEADGLRVYTESGFGGAIFIHVAEPKAHRREALKDSVLFLVLPLIALIPLSALAIAWIVKRGMRPLVRVRDAIGTRGGSHLEPIGAEALPSEIAPIAEAVDRLLLRLKAALDAERAFSATSAHELRTPIAAALAQTQRLASALAGTAHTERIAQIEASLHRLGRLVEKLLQLSRAEAGIAMCGDAADLLPALRLVVEDFARGGEGAGRIALDVSACHSLPARLDVDAFAIVMRNLIENAIRHGTADAPIEVRVDTERCVHVGNAGPVVGPNDLARLTGRFERGPATASGSGLGLAIAETIMRQAGGRMTLKSPRTGKDDGFEVVLTLP